MARNRPSKHSEAQFALFVEQMKKMLDVKDESEFEHAVRRLVGSDGPQGHEAASASSLAATLDSLPEPDFDAIESAVHETGASRANLMVLVGYMAFGFLNNENLLIYLLMVLLRTDEPSAAVVFSNLNTMRARLDLVSRLAWIRISDRATRRALDQVVRRFRHANQIRNEFSFAHQHPIDRKRLDGMAKACRDMSSLNREIWSFCRGFTTQTQVPTR